MDFKHNSQHVAAAAAASTVQQSGTISVSAMQGQQMVSPSQQQQPLAGNASTAGQVATLLPQQPQPLKPGGNQISPTISGTSVQMDEMLAKIAFYWSHPKNI